MKRMLASNGNTFQVTSWLIINGKKSLVKDQWNILSYLSIQTRKDRCRCHCCFHQRTANTRKKVHFNYISVKFTIHYQNTPRIHILNGYLRVLLFKEHSIYHAVTTVINKKQKKHWLLMNVNESLMVLITNKNLNDVPLHNTHSRSRDYTWLILTWTFLPWFGMHFFNWTPLEISDNSAERESMEAVFGVTIFNIGRGIGASAGGGGGGGGAGTEDILSLFL